VTERSRGKALAGRFAGDPVAAVCHVLRRAAAPLTATDIKQALQDGGVAKADVDRVWPRVQRKLAAHDEVLVAGRTYRWSVVPKAVTATQALELLGEARIPAGDKALLVDVVRAALTHQPENGKHAEDSSDAEDSGDAEDEARRRQSAIDAVRALAELASEAEELAVNEARPEALIHRLRARVKRSGLEPIDRAGDETTFDRRRHKPIDGAIRDGARVLVVRPGYVWKAPTEEVLIAKAVVEE